MDSKTCDAQAGYESLLTAFPAALAGANLIYGTGMVDSGMALDYGKLIMDDEINQAIAHFLKGIDVTEETLSVELIDSVGPGGNFLTHPSTFRHFKNGLFPDLMNRDSHEKWMTEGKPGLHERAVENARQILIHHQPASISTQAQKEIDEIIRETEKELGVVA